MLTNKEIRLILRTIDYFSNAFLVAYLFGAELDELKSKLLDMYKNN